MAVDFDRTVGLGATKSDGTTEKLLSDGAGGLKVGTGISGATNNRNINAASTTYSSSTNKATWETGIKELSVTPIAATAAGLQNDEACLIVFDAPNDTIASAWLTSTGGAATNVQYEAVFVGETVTFVFTDTITRIDVLPLAVDQRVILGAA